MIEKDNIIEIGKEKKFSIENELLDRVSILCSEYHADLSNASILGVLELIKTNIIGEVEDD